MNEATPLPVDFSDGITETVIKDGVRYEPAIEGFQALFNHPLFEYRKYINMVGGRGSGKSRSCIEHLCVKMLSETGKSFLICRKSMTDLRRTVYLRGNPSVIKTLNNWGYQGKYYHNQLQGYVSINGNDVYFTGVEDPDSLRSMNVNYVMMEEVTDFDWEDFLELDARSRAPNEGDTVKGGKINHIYMTSNPTKTWHWSVQHFYLNPLPAYQQNCIYHKSSPLHNPYLPTKAIEDLKRQSMYDANLFRINILGEPGLPEGLVYNHIEQLPEEMWDERIWHVQPVFGVDFGVNHAMVIMEGRKWKGAWYIRQRFFATDNLNYDLLNFMLDKNKKWKEHVKPLRSLCNSDGEYADLMDLWENGLFIPNISDYKAYGYEHPKDLIPFNFPMKAKYWVDHQPDFYRPLRTAGFNTDLARKQNVLAGIMSVKKYRLIVSSQSADTLRQLSAYSWVKKRGDLTQRDEPEKVEDDSADAIRYIIHSEETYKNVGGGFLGSTSFNPVNPNLQQEQKKPKSKAVYIPNAKSNKPDPFDGE